MSDVPHFRVVTRVLTGAVLVVVTRPGQRGRGFRRWLSDGSPMSHTRWYSRDGLSHALIARRALRLPSRDFLDVMGALMALEAAPEHDPLRGRMAEALRARDITAVVAAAREPTMPRGESRAGTLARRVASYDEALGHLLRRVDQSWGRLSPAAQTQVEAVVADLDAALDEVDRESPLVDHRATYDDLARSLRLATGDALDD